MRAAACGTYAPPPLSPGDAVAWPGGVGVVERLTPSSAVIAGAGLWGSIRLDLLTRAADA